MSETIRRHIYAEAGFDFSGSICVGATLDDLDPSAVDESRNKWAEKSGNRRIMSLSQEQLLRDCEAIIDEDGITYAALALFGKRSALGKFLPQAEMVFEYRPSNASGPANQREKFPVGFFSCYSRLWELMQA